MCFGGYLQIVLDVDEDDAYGYVTGNHVFILMPKSYNVKFNNNIKSICKHNV